MGKWWDSPTSTGTLLLTTTTALLIALVVAGKSETGTGRGDKPQVTSTFYDSKYHDDGSDSQAVESIQLPQTLDEKYFSIVPDTVEETPVPVPQQSSGKIIFEKGTTQEFHHVLPINQHIDEESFKYWEYSPTTTTTTEASSYLPTAGSSNSYTSSGAHGRLNVLQAPAEEWTPNSHTFFESEPESGPAFTKPVSVPSRVKWPAEDKPGKVHIFQKDVDRIIPQLYDFVEPVLELQEVEQPPSTTSTTTTTPKPTRSTTTTTTTTTTTPPPDVQEETSFSDSSPKENVPSHSYFEPQLSSEPPQEQAAAPTRSYFGQHLSQPIAGYSYSEPHPHPSPGHEHATSYFHPQPQYNTYVYYPVQTIHQAPQRTSVVQTIGSYFSSLSSAIRQIRIPKSLQFTGGISYVGYTRPYSQSHLSTPSVLSEISEISSSTAHHQEGPPPVLPVPQVPTVHQSSGYYSSGNAYSSPGGYGSNSVPAQTHESHNKFTPSTSAYVPDLPSAYFDYGGDSEFGSQQSSQPPGYAAGGQQYGPPGYRPSPPRSSLYESISSLYKSAKTPFINHQSQSQSHYPAAEYRPKKPFPPPVYPPGQDFYGGISSGHPQGQEEIQYRKPLKSYYTSGANEHYTYLNDGQSSHFPSPSYYAYGQPQPQQLSIFDDFMRDFMSYYYRGGVNSPKVPHQVPYGSFKKPGSVSDEYLYSSQTSYGTPSDLVTPTTLGYYRTPHGSWARIPSTKGKSANNAHDQHSSDSYGHSLYQDHKDKHKIVDIPDKIKDLEDFDDAALNCENSHNCRDEEELHNVAEMVDLTRRPKGRNGLFQKLMRNAVRKPRKRRPLPPTPPPAKQHSKKFKGGKMRRGRRKRCQRKRRRCLFF